MLYIMNDVLFHATNTYSDTKDFVASASLPYLPVLVTSLRSAPSARTETIDALLKLWSEKKYFSNKDFAQIVGERAKETKEEFQRREDERKPLVKPSMLGTSGDPHWLLPVSCMLEVIVRLIRFTTNGRIIQIIINPSLLQMLKQLRFLNGQIQIF